MGGSFRRSWTRVGSFASKYKRALLRHGKCGSHKNFTLLHGEESLLQVRRRGRHGAAASNQLLCHQEVK
ncbi:Putative LOC100568865 [Caligus rogercresseyi]|uniref:LOC100568865 n=1 Tax=Caligus rogercresseyi TaxID=217165 RepID=A0A7T8JZC7_CALRO|nr:Putative LOC100568865 [Caligus rogercresseyi]